MAFAGSQDEVISFSKLQNSPHAFDILRRVAPVAFCVQVAEEQLLLQTMLNRSNRTRDFASHKSFPAARAFVIEQNAIARAQAVALQLVNGRPISKNSCHA